MRLGKSGPPTSWQPKYDDDGDIVEHQAPAKHGPNYTVQRVYRPREGHCTYIDHDTDHAFTANEIRNLIRDLGGKLPSD